MDDRLEETEVAFWGEWEAQSEVEPVPSPVRNGPHWLHRPFFDPPAIYSDHQNTDPFVFGDQFQYTGCLQHTKYGPTQMRNLSRGSIILFGSCQHRSVFVIDTVFVVANHIDHSLRDFREKLSGRVSATYEAVTLEPWYARVDSPDRVHRLYYGASFTDPIDGMFSCFPCLPASRAPHGFARPRVFISGNITPTLTQNKKMTCVGTTAEAKTLWDQVVNQVRVQGLALGVSAELPKHRRGR